MTRFRITVVVLLACIVGGVVTIFVSGAGVTAPARLIFNYPWRVLAEESEKMNECAACHEPAKFHTCNTCHDDHGSAEMANVPFDDLILLQGDVPEPGYIPVNEILPYRDQPGTHIILSDFLFSRGVSEFESVTLASRDEGWITIDQDRSD